MQNVGFHTTQLKCILHTYIFYCIVLVFCYIVFKYFFQIQKNLTVNKSKLSATKRAKISADDTRPSAVVVGYTMGAALLTLSIGLIVVSDIPKIVSSIHVLIYNVKSRFSRSNSIVSDAVEMENS